MNKKLAIIAALVALAGAGMYTHIVFCEVALMQMHPEIDEAVVIKAHRKMVLRAFAGRYNDINLDDDAVADAIFLAIVEEISK
jgi:hypothetical protein